LNNAFFPLPSGQQITHPQLVANLAKSGDAILDSLTGDKAHAWHMASCIPGEAGELFAPLADHLFRDYTLDIENVVEELGDLEFYTEGLRAPLGISRAEVCAAGPVNGIEMEEAIFALPGKAADVFDAVKKWVIYNKELDRAAIVTALGEFQAVLETIRDFFGITLSEILATNISKLGVRYKDGYSDVAAQQRADKPTVH
jgi:hypothetical protein